MADDSKNNNNDDSKKVDKEQRKKLNLDKSRTYKDELASSRREKRKASMTPSKSGHACALDLGLGHALGLSHSHADKRPKTKETLTEEDIASRSRLKREVFERMEKLEEVQELAERLKLLRKVEGVIHCALQLGGTFDKAESDLIVDCVIRHHERNNDDANERPGFHPLQTAAIFASAPRNLASGYVTN